MFHVEGKGAKLQFHDHVPIRGDTHDSFMAVDDFLNQFADADLEEDLIKVGKICRCLAHSPNRPVPSAKLMDGWSMVMDRLTLAEWKTLVTLQISDIKSALEQYCRKRKLCRTCKKRVMAALTHMQRRSAWISPDGYESGVIHDTRGTMSHKIWSGPAPEG